MTVAALELDLDLKLRLDLKGGYSKGGYLRYVNDGMSFLVAISNVCVLAHVGHDKVSA